MPAPPAGPAASAQAPGATITITVTDLRSAKGIVRACMTADEHSFPRCRGVAGAFGATAQAREGSVSFTFRHVRPGHYAIALLHDENGNGKADRALGMMPREGFGFSRDAKVVMGPPRFEDAMFEVSDSPKSLAIKMRYMF